MATFPDAGNPVGHDHPMAQGSGFAVCQRFVGEYPLPGYGPVTPGNRLVRTRMPGGVGRAGERPALTRSFHRKCYRLRDRFSLTSFLLSSHILLLFIIIRILFLQFSFSILGWHDCARQSVFKNDVFCTLYIF